MTSPAFTDGHDTRMPPCLGPTYDDLWTAYAEGRLSSSVMRSLLLSDQVFAAYCKRMARTLRLMRDDAASDGFKGA